MKMSFSSSLFLLLFMLLFKTCFQKQQPPLSLSFPLSKHHASNVLSSNSKNTMASSPPPPPFNYNYNSPFKYSMALMISLPIGTPPQTQQMVLDTGSQLSWINCHRKTGTPRHPPPKTSFDPSLSSSFSLLPCNHPICKPRIPDFTLPTTCNHKRLCHYSYFYADGTLAEGNLVREKITFPASPSTPPLILGCAAESADAEGILGMNRGRLSFVSQANIPSFSYCVPIRQAKSKVNPTGMFYLGKNPNSRNFRYVQLLTLPESERMPNFDPLAYTVGLAGIKIGGRKLNISAAVFRPDAGGSGQTMIDSGTQYTFLVDAAYAKVRAEVVRLAGAKLKKGYVHGGALDMCFDGNALEISRLIGDMVFHFNNWVEIRINEERILDHVGGGVHCVAVGRSESLGVAGNIIGNFHLRNLWVEFDLENGRVGFGAADCRSKIM